MIVYVVSFYNIYEHYGANDQELMNAQGTFGIIVILMMFDESLPSTLRRFKYYITQSCINSLLLEMVIVINACLTMCYTRVNVAINNIISSKFNMTLPIGTVETVTCYRDPGCDLGPSVTSKLNCCQTNGYVRTVKHTCIKPCKVNYVLQYLFMMI